MSSPVDISTSGDVSSAASSQLAAATPAASAAAKSGRKPAKRKVKRAAPVELVADLDGDLALLPDRLSPSRAKDYMQCPKLFHFKTILGLRSLNTEATARGSLAHAALERLFLENAKADRSGVVALSYLRPEWDKMRATTAYEHLVPSERTLDGALPWTDFDDAMLATAEECIRGYYKMENPKSFDPAGVEIWLKAKELGVPLHGIIDRLDRVETPSGEVHWVISDYKSGKVPKDRFLDEAFFALKVYAVLLHDMFGVVAHSLRLLYIRNGSPATIKTMSVDKILIDRTTAQVEALWKAIRRSAEKSDWPTKTGPLCSWCDFQPDCPAWNTLAGGTRVEVASRRH